MSIFIARHGETLDNAQGIIQFPDSPLSPQGVTQAKQLADRLATKNITAIMASDYARAKQTALQASLTTGIEVAYNPLLREQNFGDLRGQYYKELQNDPFIKGFDVPNGENWQVFCERVALAWQDIRALSETCEGDLLVVTHGFVCKALLENHLTLPENIKSQSSYHNTALTQVEATSPWRINLLNCSTHLNPSK